MGIDATCLWEIRTTGAQTNGGFFKPGATGSDFSQQDAAQYAITTGTSAGAGNTILDASAAANMVGNGARAVSGTNINVGWYEVTSVSVGVSITFSTNAAGGSIASGVAASAVINIGGAFKIGGTLDDDVFEAGTIGNTYHVKSGSYTLGESITQALGGNTTTLIKITGYNSTRGDNPTGSNRPTLICGANAISIGSYVEFSNFNITGTPSSLLTIGTGAIARNVKSVNSSTTATRNAMDHGNNSNSTFELCEMSSYRGYALSSGNGGSGRMFGCWLRDSVRGISSGSAITWTAIECIFSGCVVGAFYFSAGAVQHVLFGNTFYGSQAKLGTGMYNTTGGNRHYIRNNVFYGFVTAIDNADVSTSVTLAYNDFYNNTNDHPNLVAGPGDVAVDPQFTNVVERTGSTATTTAGNHLVQSGATFQTWGVAAGDMLLITAGTGTTNNVWYSILTVDSETQITTGETLTANASADKVWLVRQYNNFAVGANLKAIGAPALFGSTTTSYKDIGAVQRQELGGLPPRIMQITGAHRSEY